MPDIADQINDITRRLAAGESLHTVEIGLQVQHLADAGITVNVAKVETFLGYPLAEASRAELRGVIAALNAIGRQP